mmetsp:Transcript_22695/g.41095  ORF Transcript_22695/g.41095 Transcript_22695/m.41095 type:complete len:205 (-) Transcript_22695:235-849(-)
MLSDESLPGQVAEEEPKPPLKAALNLEIRGVAEDKVEEGAFTAGASLLKELDTMLERALRMRWCFRQLGSWYHRMDLFFQIMIMVLTVALSAMHALMDIEDYNHATTISNSMSGINVAVIGLNSYLKPGKMSGEMSAASQGFSHLVGKIREHKAKNYFDEKDILAAFNEASSLLTSICHSCPHLPPPWILKEVAKVPIEELDKH